MSEYLIERKHRSRPDKWRVVGGFEDGSPWRDGRPPRLETLSALPRTPCSRSDSGEALADIMDILKDLMEDLKPKGGRLREKLILEKAFDRYEQHRSTLTHGTSPMLGICTCMNGMCGCLECPIHGRRIGNSSANAKGMAAGADGPSMTGN